MKTTQKIKNGIYSLIGGAVAQITGGEPPKNPWTPTEGLTEACFAAAADGIVLLENDGVLPLGKQNRISLFGRCQTDYFYVGYGSGGDVRAPYRVNLVEAMKKSGFLLNENLLGIYDSWRKDNPPFDGFWGHWPYNYEEMPVTAELAARAAAESDVAVTVVGRAAGEDRENKLKEGSFFLTETEKQMLESVTSAFEKTVVILDCGNVIDFSWVKKYKISAVLLAWQGGMESCNALAAVLDGRVNPSARLTDSIADSYASYPSSDAFGNPKANEYSEDIFVGYRYFETFAPSNVLYPFGYGLSYTTFTVVPQSFFADEEGISFSAEVTNTGTREGREVVQCYLSAPCGKLGKAAKSLIAFKKTPVLNPGESCRLGFSVPYYAMSSYDETGVTGFPYSYVLESGEYRIAAGKNVRETTECGKFIVENTVSTKTCAPVMRPQKPFMRMKKKHNENKPVYEPAPTACYSLKDRILDSVPKAEPAADGNISFDDVATGKASLNEFVSSLSVEDLAALSCGEGKMNSPLGSGGNAGALGGVTESLRNKGVPPVVVADGPSGIRLHEYAALLPCGTCLASSWDSVSVEKLTDLVGREMNRLSVHMLLAPGLNIHRNPLCGRNFEYYSEDPVLSGEIAAAYVRGIQKNGLSACPKHFACNNQETNRTRNDSIVSERALREIYLKPFEICISQSSPMTIMTSYNKINGAWSHYNYDLCVTVLRTEFGFDGTVITDWWMRKSRSKEFPRLKNNAYRVRSGVDVLMPGSISRLRCKLDNSVVVSFKRGDLSLGEIQRTASNVLTLCLRLFSNYKNRR